MGVEGKVTAIHRPHGGVIDCGATQVFFHRSRVYLEGVHLSVTLDLEQVLTPGMKVMVDYGPNEKEDGPIFEDCPTANVALLVYTGQQPRVSDLRHKPFPLAEDENSKYLVAKIVKFDPPGPTGVESGIAEILKPTDLNTLAFTKNSFKSYVDIVEGHISPRWRYMNGFPEGDDAKGAVCARVHDIFPLREILVFHLGWFTLNRE